MGSYYTVTFEVYVDDYGKARWVATASYDLGNEDGVMTVGEGRGYTQESAALDLHRLLEARHAVKE